jgi:hypothetical protein
LQYGQAHEVVFHMNLPAVGAAAAGAAAGVGAAALLSFVEVVVVLQHPDGTETRLSALGATRTAVPWGRAAAIRAIVVADMFAIIETAPKPGGACAIIPFFFIPILQCLRCPNICVSCDGMITMVVGYLLLFC